MFNHSKIAAAMKKALHLKEIQFESPALGGNVIHLGVFTDRTVIVFGEEELNQLVGELNIAILELKNTWIKRFLNEIHEEMNLVEVESCPCPPPPVS